MWSKRVWCDMVGVLGVEGESAIVLVSWSVLLSRMESERLLRSCRRNLRGWNCIMAFGDVDAAGSMSGVPRGYREHSSSDGPYESGRSARIQYLDRN